jgi:uncharacterized protein
MDVTPLVESGKQIIQGYGPGKFRVSGRVFEGAVLVRPDSTQSWSVAALAALTERDFEALSEGPPVTLLLLGCGAGVAPLPRGLREALRARGIVVELMDTGAAVRTYNVLLTEGREVAAALLPV